MATPVFRAGGLASGLDTNSIIDNLVKIEGVTVDKAKALQSAFQMQVSVLGDLAAKLTSMQTAATKLKTGGVLGVTQVSTNSGFAATPSSAATAGRYSLQVTQLAQAARSRSAAFTASSDPVRGGTLNLSVNGNSFDVTINDGDSLETVASAINASGAPVSASILNTGGQTYLSITNRDTGFTIGQAASSALAITETTTGSAGQPLGFTTVQSATNAQFTVDGLAFERMTNTTNDALPGVTLSLQKQGGAAEDLVLQTSTSETQKNLQSFVDAYNSVMTVIHKNLNIAAQTDRTKTLGGDPALRSLQASMLSLVSTVRSSTSSVRTLADLGIKTSGDGTLSIDAARLETAIATDPSAVNNLVQNATTGLTADTKTIVKTFTDPLDGVFTARKNGINQSIATTGKHIDALQLRLEKYRERLVAQFTAMEKIVGNFKSLASFLTLQDNNRSKSQ